MFINFYLGNTADILLLSRFIFSCRSYASLKKICVDRGNVSCIALAIYFQNACETGSSRYFCGARETKRHIGITLSSICHALLLLSPHEKILCYDKFIICSFVILLGFKVTMFVFYKNWQGISESPVTHVRNSFHRPSLSERWNSHVCQRIYPYSVRFVKRLSKPSQMQHTWTCMSSNQQKMLFHNCYGLYQGQDIQDAAFMA